MTALSQARVPQRPRLGFLGTGRIGLLRLQSLLDTGLIEAAAVADLQPEMLEAARQLAPEADLVSGFDQLLAADVDALVIATPSALHADQCITAFEHGLAVFCQKPLGRTRAEAVAVVEASRRADTLLGVDFAYRHTAGMHAIRDLIIAGTLGEIFAIDLVFHNAYGPDKPWFFDKTLSGGGCLMDLGVHLVDLALWVTGFPEVTRVSGNLMRAGEPLPADSGEVEDYATAVLELATGAQVRIACSWHLNAGRDAVIGADFYGTRGGASFHNVGGSFFDFTAARHTGTASTMLSNPPDAWPGRAPARWAQQLAEGARFDPAAEEFIAVADVLDRIYRR